MEHSRRHTEGVVGDVVATELEGYPRPTRHNNILIKGIRIIIGEGAPRGGDGGGDGEIAEGGSVELG